MRLLKIKPVVDIVFLLDVSGSMQECIDAVKGNMPTFINGLSVKDSHNEAAIEDWRMKICGYRNHQHNETNWLTDNPFVRDVAAVQAQLSAANMQSSGGGDELGSLLDALYKLAKMDQTGAQNDEDPNKWRASRTTVRVIVLFTASTFKEPMTIPEATGGGVPDVINAMVSNRISFFGLCPEWQGYLELASMDRAEIDCVATLADTPALAGLGKPGDEGKAAMAASVSALNARTSDTKMMHWLAKAICMSNATGNSRREHVDGA